MTDTTAPEVIAVTLEEHTSEALASFRPQDATIADLRETYSGLTIDGVEDRENFQLAKDARRRVRTFRTSVEKRRKELNAGALQYKRAVDAEAKRITADLREIEDPLDAQIKAIEAEKERLKEEEARKKRERTESRLAALQEVQGAIDIEFIQEASDEDFDAHLASETERFEAAEAERREREEAEARAREEAKQKRKRLAERCSALEGLGASIDVAAIEEMSEPEFDAHVASEREAHERREAERKKREEKAAAEKAELEELRKELAERKEREAEEEQRRVAERQRTAKQETGTSQESEPRGAASAPPSGSDTATEVVAEAKAIRTLAVHISRAPVGMPSVGAATDRVSQIIDRAYSDLYALASAHEKGQTFEVPR